MANTTRWAAIAFWFLFIACGNAVTPGAPRSPTQTQELGAKSVPAPETCRCEQDASCWPSDAEWKALSGSLSSPLLKTESPLAPCVNAPGGEACQLALTAMKDPFFVEEQPGATQTNGWLGAWRTALSTYTVEAKSAADVAEAVKFAQRHRLRLVVKGTGHDYLGRSSAPHSLLVWTHAMRDTQTHAAFVPAGCDPQHTPVPALSVGAGTRWLEAYQAATVQGGRYVQGGGCTSVGAAGGFTQGGGFGSFSKKFGTGAGGMLEAEVVIADGTVLVANACQNQDLFWALRGGGGGTFGIVTRMTLATHPLPERFGVVSGSITASTDAAFQALLERLVHFYRDALLNPTWGEQVVVSPKNELRLAMVFQGISRAQAEATWKPIADWVKQREPDFKLNMTTITMPAKGMWDATYLKKHLPSYISQSSRPGQPDGQFWWTSNQGEVSQFIYAYQSRYLPAELFERSQAPRLAEALFNASRHRAFSIATNKGLFGASEDARKRARETSMHPEVLSAAALVISAAQIPSAYPGLPGHAPDWEQGKELSEQVTRAMDVIRKAAPGAGSYANEADYFEDHWQESFWGSHYPRLLSIKRKYDPLGLFYCHHCVGSEFWDASGQCLKTRQPPKSP